MHEAQGRKEVKQAVVIAALVCLAEQTILYSLQEGIAYLKARAAKKHKAAKKKTKAGKPS
jgi:hypothetical protein